MDDIPVHRNVLKDYPNVITILESLMMHADFASIKAMKASKRSDFFEHEKWNNIHKSLEKCATEISSAGQMKIPDNKDKTT